MLKRGRMARIVLLGSLVAGITVLHYATEFNAHHIHLFYEILYYVPVMLAGFWFGLRGALATSLSVTALYIPFVLLNWDDFSLNDFNSLMAMTLYNVVAVILGLLRDRERKEQKRLRDAESLAAMGRAISAVAHDMKTPLIAIGGFANLALGKLRNPDSFLQDFPSAVEKMQQNLIIVVKETQRLETMVKDMLDFARPLELRESREDLSEIIAECLDLVRPLAQERKVKLRNLSPQNGPVATCDATRIKQVIINLLVNAIQASPPGETVSVSGYRRRRKLILDVTDCGCGIPADKREEVFLPFVTTKKDGTGLGLPIVKKIVEAHKGRLEILDNAEKGLTFRVSLPAP